MSETEILHAVCYFAIGYSVGHLTQWLRYRRLYNVMSTELVRLRELFDKQLCDAMKQHHNTK